jgi:hypothetical protein
MTLTLLWALASAAPVQLGLQARLVGAGGEPITTATSVEVRLYDDGVTSSTIWSDTFSVTPEGGYVSLVLGRAGNLLDSAVLDDDETWYQLSVGGTPVGARARLVSTPIATYALVARDLNGGTVSATSVSAATVSATTSVSAPSVSATTSVSAPTVSATTSVSAPSVSATTSMSAPTISATTSVSAPVVTATGAVRAPVVLPFERRIDNSRWFNPNYITYVDSNASFAVGGTVDVGTNFGPTYYYATMPILPANAVASSTRIRVHLDWYYECRTSDCDPQVHLLNGADQGIQVGNHDVGNGGGEVLVRNNDGSDSVLTQSLGQLLQMSVVYTMGGGLPTQVSWRGTAGSGLKSGNWTGTQTHDPSTGLWVKLGHGDAAEGYRYRVFQVRIELAS